MGTGSVVYNISGVLVDHSIPVPRTPIIATIERGLLEGLYDSIDRYPHTDGDGAFRIEMPGQRFGTTRVFGLPIGAQGPPVPAPLTDMFLHVYQLGKWNTIHVVVHRAQQGESMPGRREVGIGCVEIGQ
jgi:hypothetical protein